MRSAPTREYNASLESEDESESESESETGSESESESEDDSGTEMSGVNKPIGFKKGENGKGKGKGRGKKKSASRIGNGLDPSELEEFRKFQAVTRAIGKS